MLALRTELDVFSYAFSAEGKLWKQTRDMLDRGYELLGAFKDLREPTAPEIPERLAPVLAWRTEFESMVGDIDKLLKSAGPIGGKLPRQSNLFWGGVDVQPSDDKTGVDNVRLLVAAQLERAKGEFQSVLLLPAPLGQPAEDDFHEFRKRVRVMNIVMGQFPEIAKDPSTLPGLREKLDAIVKQWGAIENKVSAVHLAEKRGNSAQVQSITAEITADWAKLKVWAKDNDVDGTLATVRSMLEVIV